MALAVPTLWTNGHYYELVSSSATWPAACTAANSSSYLGNAGHLATITSIEEHDFIYTTFISGPFDAWIGAYQPPGSGEPSGNWHWVTGETWNFTKWFGGQPSNVGAFGLVPEDVAVIGSINGWNDDCANASKYYIIEYESVASGSCPTVEACTTPSLGSLQVTSSPAGASITLDGNATGQVTPFTFTVPAGSHTAIVSKSLCSAWSPASCTTIVPNGGVAACSFTGTCGPPPAVPMSGGALLWLMAVLMAGVAARRLSR